LGASCGHHFGNSSDCELLMRMRTEVCDMLGVPTSWEPKSGVYEWTEMSDYEYHEDSTHITSGDLRLFDENRAKYHYQRRLGHRVERTSPSLQLGSLVHMAVFEPETIDEQVVVIPQEVLAKDGSKRGNAWKEFQEMQRGKMLIKEDEWMKVEDMYASIRSNKLTAELLDLDGQCERVFMWEKHGLELKCKFDKFCTEAPVFFDLKTTSSLARFGESVWRYGYGLQCAHYEEGAEIAAGEPYTQVLLVVESEAPYPCGVFSLSAGAKDQARKHREEILGSMFNCIMGTEEWDSPLSHEVNLVSPQAEPETDDFVEDF